MDYEKIDDMIVRTSKKWFRSLIIDFEDLKQELWLFLLERKLTEKPIPYIQTCITNKCKSLYFARKKENEICYASVEDSSEGDVFLFEESELEFEDNSYQYVESKKDFEFLLSLLNEKERLYVIVKGYITYDLLYLKEEFDKCTKDLSEKDLKTLFETDCGNLAFNSIFFGNNNRTGGTLQYTKKTLRKKIEKVGLAS